MSTSCSPALAAVHDEAASAEDTDWPQILALYGLLERMTNNPMVTLNRPVAAAIVDGPAAGLALLDGIDDRLASHHRPDAVRAHLLEMRATVSQPSRTTGPRRRAPPASRNATTSWPRQPASARSGRDSIGSRAVATSRERQGTSRSSLISHMSTEARVPGVSAASIALNAWAPVSMSCAVPGLAAKPIVDVQISVASFEPLSAFRDPIESCGFAWRPKNEELTRRYFRERPGRRRTHIHVRRVGSFDEQLNLLHRDYLRETRSVPASWAAM